MKVSKKIDKLSRGQKALTSVITSFILETVTILSALIIPKMILEFYGSEVNGLVSSITQFLGYATLLQMGVGGVIRAELYGPLANKNTKKINMVMKATTLFFTKIAWICCIYIVLLSFIYPLTISQSFNYQFTFTLILIIGASTAAQYFWGFPYRSLVMADQKVFIYDLLQIVCTILNIIITVLLTTSGCPIHIVKVGSSIIFCIQPIILKTYCVKHYNLDSNAKPDKKAIEQRWNGAGYSLADFIHRNTDIFILTLLSDLKTVSVYSVYSIIYNGVNSIISMCTNPFSAAIGDMIAKNETKTLNDTFNIYELITHIVSSIVYSTAIATIIPFVSIYTNGITDINYIEKPFSVIILLAGLLFCLRQPYQTIVMSAGHFRQTQRGAFLEAAINIMSSIIFVAQFGLLGVAVGTLIAMAYRTIDLMVYVKKNMLSITWGKIAKRYLISAMTIVISLLITGMIHMTANTLIEWAAIAILYASITTVVVLLFNKLLFKENFSLLKHKFKNIIFRRKN